MVTSWEAAAQRPSGPRGTWHRRSCHPSALRSTRPASSMLEAVISQTPQKWNPACDLHRLVLPTRQGSASPRPSPSTDTGLLGVQGLQGRSQTV